MSSIHYLPSTFFLLVENTTGVHISIKKVITYANFNGLQLRREQVGKEHRFVCGNKLFSRLGRRGELGRLILRMSYRSHKEVEVYIHTEGCGQCPRLRWEEGYGGCGEGDTSMSSERRVTG